MGCNNRCGFSACGCLGVVLSVVFGAVIGVLFAFLYIPAITTVAWMAFGLSVLVLIFTLAAVYLGGLYSHTALARCLCRNTACLLVGTIGTLITSIAALAIVLNPASIAVSALVALGAFFFALMIIALVAFIQCIICKICCRQEPIQEC